MSVPQEHHVQFFTAVCKDWLPLLQDNTTKVIVINALKFRVRQGQVKVCGYVIMPNHLHVIWRISKGFKKEDIQRDLLKFTAREILQQVKVSNPGLYTQLQVQAADRSHQVWKRDSMSIDLYTDKFFQQKLNYIHANPCQPKWNLVSHPADYCFSSAAFYDEGKDPFQLLTHFQEV